MHVLFYLGCLCVRDQLGHISERLHTPPPCTVLPTILEMYVIGLYYHIKYKSADV